MLTNPTELNDDYAAVLPLQIVSQLNKMLENTLKSKTVCGTNKNQNIQSLKQTDGRHKDPKITYSISQLKIHQ